MSIKIQRLSNTSLLQFGFSSKRSSVVSLNLNEITSKQQIFYLKTVPIKNQKKQSFHQQKSYILDCFLNLINIIIVLLTIIKNFQQTQKTNNPQQNNHLSEEEVVETFYFLTLSLLAGTSLVYVFIVFFNLLKIVCKIHIDKQINQSLDEQTNYSSYTPEIIIKSIIYFIHPSNLLKEVFITHTHLPLTLNKLFSCIVYSRLIVMLVSLIKLTRFYGLRVKRVLKLYVGDKKDMDLFYSVKCFLKQNNLKSPFLIYAILILTLPFFLISIQTQSYQQNFLTYLQAVYDIIITMTTIGYGEMQDHYNMLRVFIVYIIVIGSLSSSFLTLTFLEWFKLNEQEQKALSSLKRHSLKQIIHTKKQEDINKFISTIILFKKQLSQEKIKKSKAKHQINQGPKLQKNQSQFYQKTKKFKLMVPSMQNEQAKYIMQSLNSNFDTFKDSCQRNILIFEQSMKMLIERTLLTNNLLEFFLMRQANEKKLQRIGKNRSDYNDSNSNTSMRSRNRVDDSIKLYKLKINIVNPGITNKKSEQQQQKTVNFQRRDDCQMSYSSKISGFNPRHDTKMNKKKNYKEKL